MSTDLAAAHHPQILDESIPEDDTPSCSAEEAIAKQDLFINEIVVAHAANLIWQGLHKRKITQPIMYVNAKNHSVVGVPISPEFYKRKKIKFGRFENSFLVHI